MGRMRHRAQSLKITLFSVLLVIAQWVSAEHLVEFDVEHFHGTDCSVCVFEKLAFIDSEQPTFESQPKILSDLLALPSDVLTASVQYKAIRAPPRESL